MDRKRPQVAISQPKDQKKCPGTTKESAKTIKNKFKDTKRESKEGVQNHQQGAQHHPERARSIVYASPTLCFEGDTPGEGRRKQGNGIAKPKEVL